MASSVGEASGLIASAERAKRILQVGHLERYNSAVVAARKIVSTPMFFEVHRLGVFTPRSLDVDVVYDVMIHDLDILLSLVNASVVDVKAVGIPVITDKNDIAQARIEFASGTVANLTASRVSTEKVRKMRFFQDHEYISIDFSRQDALRVSVDLKNPQQPINFVKDPTTPGRAFEIRIARVSPRRSHPPRTARRWRRRSPRPRTRRSRNAGILEHANRVKQGSFDLQEVR